jgi:hypothetical protein
MAKYTTQLRSLIDGGYDIFAGWDFDLFDNAYYGVLKTKIIDRYYFREIGFETAEQFKHFLKMKMNEIMPYYNEMYRSALIMQDPNFNPLNNLNTTTTETRTTSSESLGSGSSQSTNSDTNKTIFNDTPQAKLQDLDYATELTESEAEGTSGASTTSEGSISSTDEYIQQVTGSGGMRYPADIIIEWRKAFINIDVMILDELNTLFMNIY